LALIGHNPAQIAIMSVGVAAAAIVAADKDPDYRLNAYDACEVAIERIGLTQEAAPEMMATLPANLMTVSPFVSLGRLSHLEKAGLSGPSDVGTDHHREDNSRLTLGPPDLRIGGFALPTCADKTPRRDTARPR
jgi:hypothetical protein